MTIITINTISFECPLKFSCESEMDSVFQENITCSNWARGCICNWSCWLDLWYSIYLWCPQNEWAITSKHACALEPSHINLTFLSHALTCSEHSDLVPQSSPLAARTETAVVHVWRSNFTFALPLLHPSMSAGLPETAACISCVQVSARQAEMREDIWHW